MVEPENKHLNRGKWGMWKYCKSVPSLSSYLPPTRVLRKKSLRLFLSRYSAIYVKPNHGSQGRNVIKVWKTKQNDYAFIRERGKAVHCKNIDELYRNLKTRREQIVQRAINLAMVSERPFDIRVLMMRDGNGDWLYVGMVAKAAGPGWVITNKRTQGKILTVDEALNISLGWNDQHIQTTQRELIQIGYDMCKLFDDSKRRYKQIGIDMGVDTAGKLWIIETNVNPGWTLFAKLDDTSPYQRIQAILLERLFMMSERALTEGAKRIRQNVKIFNKAPTLKGYTPEEEALVIGIFRRLQKLRRRRKAKGKW